MAHELAQTNSIGWHEEDWGRRRRRRGHRHGHGPDAAHEHLADGAAAETSLAHVRVGSTVTVTGIAGDESFRGKIMGMGILPGVSVSVVRGGGRQPLVVALPGSKCVLDWRSSERIWVRGRRPEWDEGKA